MEARFERPQSNALRTLSVIWAAGILATRASLLAFIAVRSYDPTLSCDELGRKAFDRGEIPTNLDAFNDYELLCGYPPLS